jgi:RimJ/RimL family protein N-acetyltransferase
MIGEHVYLRVLEREDIPRTRDWINDPEIAAAIGLLPAISLDDQVKWFEQRRRHESYVFAICLKQSGEHIGNVGLGLIDMVSRNASFSIFIYDKKYRHAGFGTEATVLCLDFAFNHLNLHRVYLRTSATMTQAMEMYKRVGFVQEGVLREHFFTGGVYEDKILFGILREEFEAWQQRA